MVWKVLIWGQTQSIPLIPLLQSVIIHYFTNYSSQNLDCRTLKRYIYHIGLWTKYKLIALDHHNQITFKGGIHTLARNSLSCRVWFDLSFGFQAAIKYRSLWDCRKTHHLTAIFANFSRGDNPPDTLPLLTSPAPTHTQFCSGYGTAIKEIQLLNNQPWTLLNSLSWIASVLLQDSYDHQFIINRCKRYYT